MCVWVYNAIYMSQHSGTETKNDVGRRFFNSLTLNKTIAILNRSDTAASSLVMLSSLICPLNL